jgi:uncharacterized membrane protein
VFSLIVRAVRFANLLLTSLIAGMSLARVLNPSLTRLPAHVRIEYQQVLDRDIAPVMGVLGPLTVLTNLANLLSFARTPRSPASASALGGLVGVALFAVVTVRVEVPINEELHTWSSEAPPPEWEEKLGRWERGHRARTIAIVAGLGSLLLGAVRSRSES